MKSFAVDADSKKGGKCIDIEVCSCISIILLCKIQTDIVRMQSDLDNRGHFLSRLSIVRKYSQIQIFRCSKYARILVPF